MDIQISGLRRTFGKVTALDGLDLTVPGGMYGLLGTNGAGKTTLMRVLAGVLPPTAGTVRVGGHDLATRTGRLAVQRRLGYLPQDLGLYPDLSAQEFLDYVGLLKGLDDTAARRRQIGELLDMVGLADAATRKLRGFSGGMRRRVGIAQALLGDPALVVVDEPTAGLDPEERIRFRTLLASIAAGRTVLLSTHIVEDVAQTCRDTAVMARGRVVFNGPVADIVQRAEGVTWELVGQGPPATGVVVSAVSRSDGTHYRLVSSSRPDPRAVPVQPSLEEGYVALMHAGTNG
ncbi:ABC-type multidrug transport system, ATPase component [Microbispora rosea]|uniref:ABC-type multidrug transport system, ATPase component n=1 Tax=Microbispora rosea TaxID=58117 RepID=A0A1N6XQI2_9ACTN|nr:ABC transporter ATP-binding protein [Microbispora rosea]GIH51058.1 ABC transporter ATP-binding protein [Microbispora rosea subsp. rosea]SIR04580.1 ABC-type multidrug transport system, ATPase component [Microbispora rosea]